MIPQYPLILVDASGYLFRAYHALPKLTNSRGEPTGALVGVLNMLRKLIEDHRPEYIGVVFDAGGRGFRHDRYPDYKANRPAMPEDLRAQIEPLRTIIRAMGLPLLVVPGVEADDVIGTLATQAAATGLPTLISTGDKDLAQLVGEHVTLINTMTGTRLDPDGVREKFGVPPERIVDYLALMGDSVDNVPGVPKCGPKTAAKWIAEYGDLDGVMAQAGTIKGKIGESLRAVLDQLPLARDLTTIKRDVALDLGPTDLRPTPPDVETLRNWYERLESRRLLATLDGVGVAGAPTAARSHEAEHSTESEAGTEPQYELILTEAALEDWLSRLQTADLFAFDTETTALDAMQAELVGVSFALEPGRAAYVPLAHVYPGAPDQLDRDRVLARLKPLLEDPGRPKVGQNLKYDMSVLARYDIALRGIAHDTLLESYVLDSTARHDLDSLAKRFLDHDTIRFEDVAGKGAKQIGFDQVPLEQAGPYAAEDAEVTLRLHRVFQPRLAAVPALERLYREIEMPLVPVLSRLERAGVLIDSARLATQSAELARKILELEESAYRVAGRRFNLGSPKQIGAIFFDELGLPVVAKTPKGAPSTSEDVLERLAAEGHELPRIILDHRGLSKLRSTYTDKLPRMVDRDTGRVHTSYHQAVTATGRLSSSDPNLQNIPIRTEEGRRIRRAFIAASGHRLLAADYSQIELRIMAHLSGDERLLAAFAGGQDIHRATAAEILGLAPEDVTGEQRRSAKAINFGLIYGMSAFGLARQLGIERGAAQEYVDRYFERYPGVRDFMDRTRRQVREDGYVETLFGRRLHLPEIGHGNQARRAAAERTAINAPMQGTAADIIKRAMIAVDAWIEAEQPAARLILQVHDELVLEVAESAVEETRARVCAAMETAAELAVPLVVDIGEGANWDDAH
ncbi:DNA polymerase I [Allochromatium vinosum]|uniref:DNA polymerase I n=1 Tax=Allochromatium vinosum (strain ATCC 17899 / DSM 180 / NBRC 103801 / NCIMB 10441 / D) TaxID=572477 RepID=D3RTB3_ALLVD|nr:DNA polymerase I [Allochromatium vinosum]ADC62422.1 DNA polymerase I [Allochromatium vinosum DSM 180]